jgi:hypothetical protein
LLRFVSGFAAIVEGRAPEVSRGVGSIFDAPARLKSEARSGLHRSFFCNCYGWTTGLEDPPGHFGPGMFGRSGIEWRLWIIFE